MDVAGSRVTLRLLGTCATCPWGHLTLGPAFEALVREQVPDVIDVQVVRGDLGPLVRDPPARPASGRQDARVGSAPLVVGASAPMRELFDFARVVAEGDATVLVTGETGTGKEVLASFIHHASLRRARPFVPVSCAVPSATLVESELFGHERGAFTGAVGSRPGRFEQAEGGTVFLDDIDDIPLALQVKLLRVLQERSVERLGGRRPVPVDIRVIAASKCDLKVAVAEGRFREDLYHRLNVIPIVMPPLRRRPDDIPALTEAFLTRGFRARGVAPRPVSSAVRRVFAAHVWPGNVRELENTCERITETCQCDPIRLPCVPSGLFGVARDTVTPPRGAAPPPASLSLDDRLREVEAGLLRWALHASGGNRSAAARLLHISRSRLLDRLKRLRIEDGRDGDAAGPDLRIAPSS